MAVFEKVSKYNLIDIHLPVRKTKGSAGYDIAAAKSTQIPSYWQMMQGIGKDPNYYDLDSIKQFIKDNNMKPTLIPTGIKCKLDPGTYLELTIRSSSPLKSLLVLANGVGVIDADYYNNPDNEGEIFFQVINLSPFNVMIEKGETLGQAIIHKYETTIDDNATGERVGGFGSTSK